MDIAYRLRCEFLTVHPASVENQEEKSNLFRCRQALSGREKEYADERWNSG